MSDLSRGREDKNNQITEAQIHVHYTSHVPFRKRLPQLPVVTKNRYSQKYKIVVRG
jgi:hypothetical protein